jgi:hypothetical protein
MQAGDHDRVALDAVPQAVGPAAHGSAPHVAGDGLILMRVACDAGRGLFNTFEKIRAQASALNRLAS